MLSTLLVIAGVLVGLLALLTLIVMLSARPGTSPGNTTAPRVPGWVPDSGRPHPNAWDPSTTSTEIRALR